MSVELYVYATAAAPVLRTDLDQAAEALGWTYRLFEDLEAFGEYSGADIPTCTILGWEDEDLSEELSEIIGRRDRVRLNELFEGELVGVVTVDLEKPYSPDPEMLEEIEDDSIRKQVAESNLFYSVRTSAGRNSISLELQEWVWRLLGVALYGVIEDPQEGVFEHLSRESMAEDDE